MVSFVMVAMKIPPNVISVLAALVYPNAFRISIPFSDLCTKPGGLGEHIFPFYPVGIGEGLRLAKDRLGEKNVYYMNPSFDK